LPAEGATSRVAPSSTARLTAAAMPRALNDPVGLTLSLLTSRLARPKRRPRRGAGMSGVPPSPSESTDSQRSTGRSSDHRQSPPVRRAASASRVSVAAARSKS
jgi:hypothetical protein